MRKPHIILTTEAIRSGLILSERRLPDYEYVNIGVSLASALTGEDLNSQSLPMKAWDALQAILKENTHQGILAIENFAILFEPALKINIQSFLQTAMRGRQLVLKLEHPVAPNYVYYPFPEDHSYLLDLTGISSTTC